MINSGIIQDGMHHFPVRVYYSDTDAGGVVYHGRYLDMAEHARTEMLRLAGQEQTEQLADEGCGFVVQSLSITYRRPAYLDDLLEIRTVIMKQGVFSMVLKQSFYRSEELLSDMEIKVGYVSISEGKPLPIPDTWKQLS